MGAARTPQWPDRLRIRTHPPLETRISKESIAEGLYFGPTDAPVFGWWHKPAGPARDTGVVLCAPFGREQDCAHRSLREIAHRLAAAGLPVLRFDFAGCGDSGGNAASGDAVSAWVGSVHAAVDELKGLTGVGKLVVAGLRLGATLGMKAALSRNDVTAIVAIAPVLSGRKFVRELAAMQGTSASAGSGTALDDVLESGGYALEASAREGLAAVDLSVLVKAPAPRMLVIDRDELPSLESWAAQLGESGCDVAYRVLPGYAEMMQDPHKSQIPRAMIDVVTDWIGEASGPHLGSPASPTRMPRGEAQMGDAMEMPVWIEAGSARLSAILSRPARAVGTARDGVVLLNAGSTRRTGPSRMYVDLARRWAASGRTVLRIDLSGIGDSDAQPGLEENVVYSRAAMDEVGCAVGYLREQLGVAHCTALGMCSGAYHAFKAAVLGAPLDGVIAINPLTFFRHDGIPLEPGLQDHQVVSEMARHRANLFTADRWRRLLRADLDLRRHGHLLWRWLNRTLDSPRRDFARWLRLPLQDDLAREIQSAVSRGISLQFVFAAGDPGAEMLQAQGGIKVRRMQRNGEIGVHVVADADHTFTRRAPRAAALTLIADLIAPPPTVRRR